MLPKKTQKKNKLYRRRKAIRKHKKAYNLHYFKKMGNQVVIGNDVLGTGAPKVLSGGISCINTGTAVANPYLSGYYDLPMGAQFTADMINGVNEFQVMFDRYKLIGVKLKILYQQNSFSPEANTASTAPILNYSFDPDNSSPPSSLDIQQQRGTNKIRILNANKPFSIYLKPRVTTAVYNDNVSQGYIGYANEKAKWIDFTYLDVVHYGLKMWLQDWCGSTNNNQQILTIQPVFYFACKDTQ